MKIPFRMAESSPQNRPGRKREVPAANWLCGTS